MADQKSAPQMRAAPALAGLAGNAMALIAPGAFLWITFSIQATTGTTAPAMWSGTFFAILLSLATASSSVELFKLNPGSESSYDNVAQIMCTQAEDRYARIFRFAASWGSYLHYWVYPGIMVGLTGVFTGYVAGFLCPHFISGSNPGPTFMATVAIVITFVVARVARHGLDTSTSFNFGVNVIQISALALFSILAIGYRIDHPQGAQALNYDSKSQATYTYKFISMPDGSILRNADGVPVPTKDSAGNITPFTVEYTPYSSTGKLFQTHPNARSVIANHNFNWIIIQSTIAIFLMAGFQLSRASRGSGRTLRRTVVTPLLIQGIGCYLIQYFAANYFLNSGYSMQQAIHSAAPIGDIMIIIGDALLGQGHGKYFMLAEAVAVFLALIGTTLMSMNTSALAIYTRAKDEGEAGHLEASPMKRRTPHGTIRLLSFITAIIGAVVVMFYFADGSAPSDTTIAALPRGIFSSFGYLSHDTLAALPNTMLTFMLISNLGMFIAYAHTCTICLIAYSKHHSHNLLRHALIPGLGLVANLVCISYYLVGPFIGYGPRMEYLSALAIASIWGGYGVFCFVRSSRTRGESLLLENRTAALAKGQSA